MKWRQLQILCLWLCDQPLFGVKEHYRWNMERGPNRVSWISLGRRVWEGVRLNRPVLLINARNALKHSTHPLGYLPLPAEDLLSLPTVITNYDTPHHSRNISRVRYLILMRSQPNRYRPPSYSPLIYTERHHLELGCKLGYPHSVLALWFYRWRGGEQVYIQVKAQVLGV